MQCFYCKQNISIKDMKLVLSVIIIKVQYESYLWREGGLISMTQFTYKKLEEYGAKFKKYIYLS